jgi:3-dehydroquinate synthase
MHKIEVKLDGGGYDILIGKGLLGDLWSLVPSEMQPSRIMIVTNPSVDALYGDTLREALAPLGCDVVTDVIPEGEEWKTLETVVKLFDRMVEARLDRGSLVVVLGGGVVGDIAGFAAATYMRGIPFAQVPTTLLAQVDSSIGGKTGVDHPKGKNLIGAFHQPVRVCIDPAALASLPEEQMRNGMAEVIKYGVIADESLFALLERHAASLGRLDEGTLEDVIRRCCQIKARIVQQDVRETTGLRAILNYGHTIGHAVESVTGYTRFSHGEAVSIGMVAAAGIATRMELLDVEAASRQKALLEAAGLPTSLSGVEPGHILEAMLTDKKAVGGNVRFVLPMAIGRVMVKDSVPTEIALQALVGLGDS